jgi:PhnB protein
MITDSLAHGASDVLLAGDEGCSPAVWASRGSSMALHKPHGYSSVSPYLIVNGASGTIRFAVDVLGATELRRYDAPGGGIMHAEVRIDDSVVMIADATEHWPALPAHVHVYVQDVDDTYRRAIAAGATSVQEPVKKEDEDKRGGVKDLGGTTWWIATRVG